MKNIFVIVLVALSTQYAYSQNIGINNDGSSPDPSAILDVKSTDKGVLVPRMDSMMRKAIASPAIGLLVFDTDTKSFWYFKNSSWSELGAGGNDKDWMVEQTTNAPTSVSDEIYHLGNVAIGKDSTMYPLDISGNDRIITNIYSSRFPASGTTAYGSYIEMLGTGAGEHIGTYQKNTGNGAGEHIGTYNDISGNGGGIHFGTYDNLEGNGSGIHYGSYQKLGGTGTGNQFGAYHEISNSGNAVHYGVYNLVSGFGQGDQHGTYQFIANSGDGSHHGSNNILAGTGDGIQMGTRQTISNSGSGNHFGSYNSLSGSGAGTQYGTFQSVSNTGNSTHIGSYNALSGSGTGIQYGAFQQITNSGFGIHYGSYSALGGTGNGEQYASYQAITNTGLSAHYGSYSTLNGAGTGTQYGSYQIIRNFGSGLHYGAYNKLEGIGSGDQYGAYQSITNTGNGVHYGTYNTIALAGNGAHYAGYFDAPGGSNDYAAVFNAGNVVVNESGGDYNFRVESKNKVNALVVDANSDNVGIGTASPTSDLEIAGTDNTDAIEFDGGKVRLRHHFDLISSDRDFMRFLLDADSNQTNSAFSIYKDVTTSSASTASVNFHLDGGYSWINGGGNLGIGTATPDVKLAVAGPVRASFDDTEAEYVEIKHGGFNGIVNTVGDGQLLFQHDGVTKMSIDANGRFSLGVGLPSWPIHLASGAHVTFAGVWVNASDLSKKKEIEDLGYGLNEVMQMRPKHYFYKTDDSESIGFIAQEMEEIIPEVVSGDEGEKGIAYGLLTATLVNAIQEQQETINTLLLRIEKLEND